MQLSARILTALAVLAFVVGVVVGAQNAQDEASAATGTIDALNVGTCVTTNADVFGTGHCTQLDAFYQQGELEDLIEVDTLYGTYAHDPATAAESPRAILEDGDLIRISVTDSGRDRRDPVLITTDEAVPESEEENPFAITVDDPETTDVNEAGVEYLRDGDLEATADGVEPDAKGLVAEVVGVDEDDLPALEQQVEFDQPGVTGDTTFEQSGTYEIIWGNDAATPTDDFKPIATDGAVKFFGRVDDGIAGTDAGDEIDGFGPFRDLGSFITLDEDVISGEPNEPPVMTLNISVPDSAGPGSGHRDPTHLLRNQWYRIHPRR